jgi:hypothetical protein
MFFDTKIRCAIVICVISICNCVQANPVTSKINGDNVNLKAKKFLEEIVSTDMDRREMANVYLLGVMDATEGKVWCDYKTFKTITLQEFIFESMKRLSPVQLEKRASVVIEDTLRESFPCKRVRRLGSS